MSHEYSEDNPESQRRLEIVANLNDLPEVEKPKSGFNQVKMMNALSNYYQNNYPTDPTDQLMYDSGWYPLGLGLISNVSDNLSFNSLEHSILSNLEQKGVFEFAKDSVANKIILAGDTNVYSSLNKFLSGINTNIDIYLQYGRVEDMRLLKDTIDGADIVRFYTKTQHVELDK